MGCGMSTIKYLLFLFNLIFVLCGLALLVIGVLGQIQLNNMSEVVSGKFQVPTIALIVIGSIIFVIAFYGCCGSIRESHCMVITFAIFLLVILIIEVAIAVVAFVYADDVEGVLANELQNLVQNYSSNTEAVDSIQKSLQCCGSAGVNDYPGEIPKTCCPEDASVCDRSNVFKIGCQKAIENLINYEGLLLGGIAIGVAVIELIGVIFALCLASSIKNESRRGVYH